MQTEAISTAVAHLGYTQLREQQEHAVRYFLRGNDVFVSLPTGSGKSLCYCLLPKAFDVNCKEGTRSIRSCCSMSACGADERPDQGYV